MFFRSLAIVFVLCALGAPSFGQEWAQKLFKVKSHDFGTVLSGSPTVFEFELENIYEEDLHIKSVRANCGCTTPSITKSTLKTWEKGSIKARFNTGSFIGDRSATITVIIDRPFPAEVQLQVKGTVRKDIVIKPSVIDFGIVNFGDRTTRKIHVACTTNPEWEIKDVFSVSRHLEVTLKEVNRDKRGVLYEMNYSLKESAPVGMVSDEVVLVTNDPKFDHIVINTSGKVSSPVSISPKQIDFGEVNVGQTVTKKVFIRGKNALNVSNIECDSDCIKCQARKMKPNLTMLSVSFSPNAAAEKNFDNKIRIESESGSNVSLGLPVSARVR